MNSWSDYYQRQSNSRQTTFLQEQCLYEHLLHQVKTEAPETLIARFQELFIGGVGYGDVQVWQALKQIVNTPLIEKDFKFILNRSCHILINHWLMQPTLHKAIPKLIALFDRIPVQHLQSSAAHTTLRLQTLVQGFTATEQYAALKRLTQVVNPPDWATDSTPLITLLRRYPCLYDHSLLTEDSTEEQRRRIRQIRRYRQQQFEQDLSRYTTYKRLDSQLLADTPIERSIDPSRRSLRNPTLLNDRQLDHALYQFGGKIDGSNTYRDLAHCFLTYSRQARSYRSFKRDLYEYLAAAIDDRYGNQFNHRLSVFIRDILSGQDDQCLNDVLLVGTCRNLLKFLTVESLEHPNHSTFVDLTGNLGIPATVGLLLKVVLICRHVKPYLEKRFAILFKHYETCTKDSVVWLIESLENLNVAFSINFGSLTL